MITQKCSWSSKSISTTILVSILIIGMGIVVWQTREHMIAIAYALWGCYIVMCFATLIFMPLEVKVGDESISVVFSLRQKEFAFKDIQSIEPYQVTMNFVRYFGSGGFFGWWGWFRNQELGRFMVYASELDHVFLLKMRNGKRYVISCSDPAALCAAVNTAKAQA